MAKTKTRGANLPVPQSREEASSHLRRIGELNRDLARREADMNDALARIKEKVEAAADPLREESKALTEGLKTWCEANRAELTGGHKVKFALLGTGQVSWRLRPAKVSVPKDQESFIALLRRLGLGRFVRVKEEVNRDAMLDDKEAARAVPGVRIASEGEDFIVEPFEAELAREAA